MITKDPPATAAAMILMDSESVRSSIVSIVMVKLPFALAVIGITPSQVISAEFDESREFEIKSVEFVNVCLIKKVPSSGVNVVDNIMPLMYQR